VHGTAGEPAMPSESQDVWESAVFGPSGHCLGGHPENLCCLARTDVGIVCKTFACGIVHSPPLSFLIVLAALYEVGTLRNRDLLEMPREAASESLPGGT
jgi:hypothetical protein